MAIAQWGEGGPPDPRSQPEAYSRFLFERGLEVRRASDGRWMLQSAVEEARESPPFETQQVYGLRPVVAAQHELLRPVKLLLAPAGGDPLDLAASAAWTEALDNRTVGRMALNISYALDVASYHCKALAERYADACRAFAKVAPAGREQHDMATFAAREPFYEFDALVTSVCRCYEALRYPLWSAFGGGGGFFKSFKKLLKRPERMPAALSEQLQHSWDQHGARAKDYRDCIQHYVPLGSWMPSAYMERLAGDVWSTAVWLPDNPEAKSSHKFRYDARIDALSYGWDLVAEVVRLTAVVLEYVCGHAQDA